MTATTTPRQVERARPPRRRRLLRAIAIACLATFAVIVVGASAVYLSLPSVADAPARVRAIERAHRGVAVSVPANSRLARATVAVEDRRFFEHGAIDPLAVGRVVVDSVLHPSVDPGGATIAQQLAKVLYGEPTGPLGEIKSIGLAFKLEQRYSKAQILHMYLSSIYYGHGFWGAGRASSGYFHRPAGELSWSQAALLAGLPQAPSLLDPLSHPYDARLRRVAVLDALVRSDALTERQAQALRRAPLFAGAPSVR